MEMAASLLGGAYEAMSNSTPETLCMGSTARRIPKLLGLGYPSLGLKGTGEFACLIDHVNQM